MTRTRYADLLQGLNQNPTSCRRSINIRHDAGTES